MKASSSFLSKAQLKVLLIFSIVLMTALPGCSSCSGCSRGCGDKAAAPPSPADKADSGAAGVNDTGVAANRSRVAVVSQIGDLVPYGVDWVAVFSLERVTEALHKVARLAPKLVRGRDYHDIRARLLDLYGVDLEKTKGPCIMAKLKKGGLVLVCSKGADVVEPVDAARWTLDRYRGPLVMRRSTLVGTGVVDGRLVAGEQNALFAALNNWRNKMPSIGAAFARKDCRANTLMADDEWQDFALIYMNQAPVWCPEDICSGAAISGGRTGFRAVAVAEDLDNVKQLNDVVRSFWDEDIVGTWKSMKERENLPPELFVDSGISLQDHHFENRADRVILTARGDVFDMISIILLDSIDWVLGL